MKPLTQEQVERRREYKRAYYQRNREKIIARTSEYQRRNPEVARKSRAKWVAKNPEREAQRLREKNWRTYGASPPTRPAPDVCECCGKMGSKALSLDHCHETGAFRGWLCEKCNLGLGLLGDAVASVERALEYLKRAGG